jgi:AbrB family looped-hinge helix DNA binding protein
MITAQVSDKGQITVPAQVRRKLGMKAKSRVEIEVRGNELVVRPIRSVMELSGIFSEAAKGKPTDWETIRAETYRAMADEYRKKHDF